MRRVFIETSEFSKLLYDSDFMIIISLGYDIIFNERYMNMNEKKILKLTDEIGREIEYEILIAFKWTKTNKNYIVYTDNTNDENGNLNVFASIYYPNDNTKLDSIETDEEWYEIDRRIQKYSKDVQLDE